MRRYLLLLLSLVASGSLLVAACFDDDDDSGGSAGANTDIAMLVALDIMDGAEWHAMDEALQEEGAQIDAWWLGAVGRARTAAGVAEWDASLQDLVDEFMAASGDLETALEADDAAAAAPAARAAHEAYHELSDSAFDLLREHAGLAAAADDHD